MQRYDAKTDKWWLIPTKVHKAQIAGDLQNVSMGKTFFSGSTIEAQSFNGASIATELGVDLGAEFKYTGSPYAIDIPDLSPWTIDLSSNQITGAFINSVSINVDFPSPATITYTFEFPINQGE